MVSRDTYLTILIIILVLINVLLFANGINLDCEECTIKFRNNRISGAQVDVPAIEVKALDLFEGFKEGNCPIKWERVRGYYE